MHSTYWRASEASETLVQIRADAVCVYIYVRRYVCYNWRASEASETLQIRAGTVYIYMYGGMYAIIVAHATHTLCGRS